VAGFAVEPGVGTVGAGLLGASDGVVAAVAGRAGVLAGRAAAARRNTSQVIAKP
jgi:hypothetical protein